MRIAKTLTERLKPLVMLAVAPSSELGRAYSVDHVTGFQTLIAPSGRLW